MLLAGSRTEANLRAAFEAEAAACSTYRFYAARASRDGFESIAELFERLAQQEQEHARIWFNMLQGQAHTPEYLRSAVAGEGEQAGQMYREYERAAEEEGFSSIAETFRLISTIEEVHGEQLADMLRILESGALFNRSEPVRWMCRNCGYTHEANQAPVQCPACKYPQGYYRILPRST